jgi:MYXO-CTERM domain-containing protein
VKRAALLVLTSLACAACAGPEATDEARQPIVGGTPDTGDPAVVMLVSYPPDQSTFDACTASLVAPKVLLTAAHCLDPQKHPGWTFGVFTGPDASPFSTAPQLAPHLLPVAEVHMHPEYDSKAPFHADIGVALLVDPLDVTPLPVNRAPLDDKLVGGPARIVGYGQIKYGEYHAEKREAATVIGAIGMDDTLVVGDLMHRSCVGDSGGPALVTLNGVETIVGVDSYAELTGCLEPAHYRRPDRYTDFVDTYVPPPPKPDAGGAGGSGGTSGSSGETGGQGGELPLVDTESGGCAVAGGPVRETPWTLVALGALLAISRRRRKRA